MILIEKTEIVGLEPTIRGMRNPMNSWEKSDSNIGCELNQCHKCAFELSWCGNTPKYIIGPNDLDLMLRLARAGSVDGKFRRMIAVYVDITAPLYWWKEFDTYKVGTVANSCSTMHKIHAKEFTLEDFSHEHLFGPFGEEDHECWTDAKDTIADIEPFDVIELTICMLNKARELYLDYQKKATNGDEFAKIHVKEFWWQMIQLLPSSYNQKRTVMLNYEVLSNIYRHRRNHKLDEWRELCKWIENLPYSEVITCNVSEPTEAEKNDIQGLKAAINKLRSEKWSNEQIAKLLQRATETVKSDKEC